MTETSTGTSVPVTDEMVETAAQAMWERLGQGESWSEIYHASAYRRDARAALEAAAPQIAAAAIRRAIDAADEAFAQGDIPVTQWGNGYIDGQGAALDFIRDYANEMETDRG